MTGGSGGNMGDSTASTTGGQRNRPIVDVVIPVLNEARVLERSVQTVREFLREHLPHTWRIVIVDNSSLDGTADIGRRLAADLPDVTFLHLDQRGRGRALRHAWTSSDADILSYMDVDLSTELEALPPLVNAVLKEGYDVATGSRLMKESRITRSTNREFISRCYNLLVKAVLFTSFSDAQCGFKAVSRRVVDEIVPEIKDQSWFFDTELLVLAEKQGYSIKDIPVCWIEDDDSRVKIVPTAWDDIKGVFRLRWQLIRRAFFPHAGRRQARSNRTAP
jgi:glycosyltransferase involved in cell wall biosynthesis